MSLCMMVGVGFNAKRQVTFLTLANYQFRAHKRAKDLISFQKQIWEASVKKMLLCCGPSCSFTLFPARAIGGRWQIFVLFCFSVLIVCAAPAPEHKPGAASSWVISLSFVYSDRSIIIVGAICLGRNSSNTLPTLSGKHVHLTVG